MTKKLDEKMLSGFSRELRGYLTSIRESIERLPSQPDALEQATQGLTTITGALQMIGFTGLSHLTSHLRDTLEESRGNQSALDTALHAWLGSTIVQLERNLEAILAGQLAEDTFVAEVEHSRSRYKEATITEPPAPEILDTPMEFQGVGPGAEGDTLYVALYEDEHDTVFVGESEPESLECIEELPEQPAVAETTPASPLPLASFADLQDSAMDENSPHTQDTAPEAQNVFGLTESPLQDEPTMSQMGVGGFESEPIPGVSAADSPALAGSEQVDEFVFSPDEPPLLEEWEGVELWSTAEDDGTLGDPSPQIESVESMEPTAFLLDGVDEPELSETSDSMGASRSEEDGVAGLAESIPTDTTDRKSWQWLRTLFVSPEATAEDANDAIAEQRATVPPPEALDTFVSELAPPDEPPAADSFGVAIESETMRDLSEEIGETRDAVPETGSIETPLSSDGMAPYDAEAPLPIEFAEDYEPCLEPPLIAPQAEVFASEPEEASAFDEFEHASIEDDVPGLLLAPPEANAAESFVVSLLAEEEAQSLPEVADGGDVEPEAIPPFLGSGSDAMAVDTPVAAERTEISDETASPDVPLDLLMSNPDDDDERTGQPTSQGAGLEPWEPQDEYAINAAVAGEEERGEWLGIDESLPALLFDPTENLEEESPGEESFVVPPAHVPVESPPMEGTTEASMLSDPPGQELSALVEAIDNEVQEAYGQAKVSPDERRAQGELQSSERYLLCTLAGSRYAVGVPHVLEISRVPQLTAVPNVPEWVRGVINLRGEIISAIDLRTFLGLEKSPQPDQSRLLIVKTNDDTLTTSLIVDEINGFARLPAHMIQDLTMSFQSNLDPYLVGISDYEDQVLAVLDLERFLQSSEMCQFDAT